MKAMRAILVLGVVAAALSFAPAAQAAGGLKISSFSASDDGTNCTVVVQADWHPKHGQQVVHFALERVGISPVPVDLDETLQAADSTATGTFVFPSGSGQVFVASVQVRTFMGEELASGATKTAVECF